MAVTTALQQLVTMVAGLQLATPEGNDEQGGDERSERIEGLLSGSNERVTTNEPSNSAMVARLAETTLQQTSTANMAARRSARPTPAATSRRAVRSGGTATSTTAMTTPTELATVVTALQQLTLMVSKPPTVSNGRATQTPSTGTTPIMAAIQQLTSTVSWHQRVPSVLAEHHVHQRIAHDDDGRPQLGLLRQMMTAVLTVLRVATHIMTGTMVTAATATAGVAAPAAAPAKSRSNGDTGKTDGIVDMGDVIGIGNSHGDAA